MRHVNVTIDFAGDEKAADIAAVAAFVAATPDGGVSVTTAGDGSAVFTVPVTDAGVGMVGGCSPVPESGVHGCRPFGGGCGSR